MLPADCHVSSSVSVFEVQSAVVGTALGVLIRPADRSGPGGGAYLLYTYIYTVRYFLRLDLSYTCVHGHLPLASRIH